MASGVVTWYLTITLLLAMCEAGTPYCSCPSCINCVSQPVCGVDGVTYANPCLAKCQPVKINYNGECVVSTPTMAPQVVNFDVVYTNAPDTDNN